MNKVAGEPELRRHCWQLVWRSIGMPEAPGLAALLRDDYQKYGAYIRQFNISEQ